MRKSKNNKKHLLKIFTKFVYPRLKFLTKQEAAETAKKAGKQKDKAGGRTKKRRNSARLSSKKSVLNLLSAIYYSDRLAIKHVCTRLL